MKTDAKTIGFIKPEQNVNVKLNKTINVVKISHTHTQKHKELLVLWFYILTQLIGSPSLKLM